MQDGSTDHHRMSSVRELKAHIRKDFQLLISGTAPIFLFSAMLALGFIAAYSASIDFSQDYDYYSSMHYFDVDELFAEKILYYWNLLLSIWPLIVAIVVAASISQEKENGMLQYILTYRPRSHLVYFSKLTTLSAIFIMVILSSAAIFQTVFFFMNGRFIPGDDLFGSCIYPIFAIIILVQLCILVALLIKKKGAGLIATVCIVLSLFAVSTLLTSTGIDEMMDRSSDAPGHGMDPDYFPAIYKWFIVLNPIFLKEGIVSVLGLSIDYQSGIFVQGHFQVLGPGWYFGYIAISMILYSFVSIGVIHYNVPRRVRYNG